MRYTLRPKLTIRNVAIDSLSSLLSGEPLNAAGSLEIYNGGASEARVSSIACRLFAFHKLPMIASLWATGQPLDRHQTSAWSGRNTGFPIRCRGLFGV
jgi:hypothetical protein